MKNRDVRFSNLSKRFRVPTRTRVAMDTLRHVCLESPDLFSPLNLKEQSLISAKLFLFFILVLIYLFIYSFIYLRIYW